MDTVVIIGVGLIGGSFGLALKKAGFRGRILGVSSAAAVKEALLRGAIDEALPLEHAVPVSDLVYIAQPIRRILETLDLLNGLVRPGALVTDAGSTKASIVERAAASLRRAQFLGGHPMAGKEKRGVGEADAGLFAGRTYVLTPTGAGDLETPAAREFLSWVRAIGALPLALAPAEHDRVVACTSHVPQLLSTALAATLDGRLSASEHLRTAGPGLADMLRLAASSYEIWGDILATNAGPIAEALTACIAELQRIQGGQAGAAFERANSFVTRFRSNR